MSGVVAEPPTDEHRLETAEPSLGESTALFARVAAAVRNHQLAAARAAAPPRPADLALYRTLDELER